MDQLSVGEVARAIKIARLLWQGCERPKERLAPSAADLVPDMNLDRLNRLVTGVRSQLGLQVLEASASRYSDMRKAVDTAFEVLQIVAQMSRKRNRMWGPMEYLVRGHTINSLARLVKPENRGYVRDACRHQAGTIVKVVGADKLRHLLTLRT